MNNKYFTDKDVNRYIYLEKKRLKISKHRELLQIVNNILEEIKSEENPNKWQIIFYEAVKKKLSKKKRKKRRSLNG